MNVPNLALSEGALEAGQKRYRKKLSREVNPLKNARDNWKKFWVFERAVCCPLRILIQQTLLQQ